VCFESHLVQVGLTFRLAIVSLRVLQIKRSFTGAWHLGSQEVSGIALELSSIRFDLKSIVTIECCCVFFE